MTHLSQFWLSLNALRLCYGASSSGEKESSLLCYEWLSSGLAGCCYWTEFGRSDALLTTLKTPAGALTELESCSIEAARSAAASTLRMSDGCDA